MLGFLLFGSISTYAQVSIYGSAGVNYSHISFDNYEFDLSSETSNGGFLTVGISIPISQKLYLINELNASVYSSKILILNGTPESTYNQLNIQTGLGYQLGPIRLEGGVMIGKTLSHNLSFEDTRTVNESYSDSDNINLNVFAGLNLSITKNIGLFSRYYHGLNQFGEFNLLDFQGNAAGVFRENMKNLQIGLSFLIL